MDFFLGKIIPGTSITYQEAVITHTRDYLVENGVSLKEMVNADVVRCVRVKKLLTNILFSSICILQESFPAAWKNRDPAQAGKSLRHMLDKALKLRRQQKSIIQGSGRFNILYQSFKAKQLLKVCLEVAEMQSKVLLMKLQV